MCAQQALLKYVKTLSCFTTERLSICIPRLILSLYRRAPMHWGKPEGKQKDVTQALLYAHAQIKPCRLVTLLQIHARSIMSLVFLGSSFKKARLPSSMLPSPFPRLLRFTGHEVEVFLYTLPTG